MLARERLGAELCVRRGVFVRAQAAAAHHALAEEASRLRGALAQEQGERARLLGGMRDALAGLSGAGDVEGRLRSELLQAHQVRVPKGTRKKGADLVLAQSRGGARASPETGHDQEVVMPAGRVQEAAAARSAQERAEAQASSRGGEVQALRERLQASEKVSSFHTAALGGESAALAE